MQSAFAGGTFTIDNTQPAVLPNFINFTSCINYLNSLNTCGAFSGPVMVNVTAGQTFIENPPALLASGSIGNPITFQRIGIGANPQVRPTGTATTNEGGITLQGCDYTVFDGIDVAINSGDLLEFGYKVMNVSGTSGAHHNVIKNCAITLNRNNTASTGIICTSSTTGGGFTATSVDGSNSFNKFYNLTIQNCYNGVHILSGSTALPGLGNEVGVEGGGATTIGAPYAGVPTADIGSFTLATATFGIQMSAQGDFKIFGCTIQNIGSTTGLVRGILISSAVGTCEVYNNRIRGLRRFGNASTVEVSGINAGLLTTAGPVHRMRIYNNFISDLSSAYTGASTTTRSLRGITLNTGNVTSSYDVDFNNIHIDGSGSPNVSNVCIEAGTSATATNFKIRNNVLANFTGAQVTAQHSCIRSVNANQLGAAAETVSNYNDLYIANTTGGFVGITAATTRNTVADWTAALTLNPGSDLNSINVDPFFVAPPLDLHVQWAGLNSAGNMTGITWANTDIDGDVRGTPPDIGADEFIPPSCYDPTGTVIPFSACGTGEFFLDVTVTNLNFAPGVDVVSNYTGNPGAVFGVGLGTYQIGPFPSNTPVQVSLLRNGDASCDVVLGTFTYDCSIHGQNSIFFDGVNDGVLLPGNPSLNITGTNITLEAWIYPTAFKPNTFDGNIINKEGGNAGYQLRCGGSGILQSALGTGAGYIEVTSPAGTLSLNTWQHVAVTYDGANARLYKNGVQVASIAGTAAIVTTPNAARIGDYAVTPGARTFAGRIDEVRIWNVARAQSDIAAFQTQQLCGDETGLQAYYKFDQGTAGGNNAAVTTLLDATANANNGSLYNLALTGGTSNWVQGVLGMNPCTVCTGTPTAGAITGNGNACTGVSNLLTLNGATFGIGISRQWKYGPVGGPYTNLLGTALNQNTSAIPVGAWEVVVDVTCSAGPSTATTLPFALTVNPTPTGTASAGPACLGQPLNFTGTTDIGTSFLWTGPSGFNNTNQNPTIASLAAANNGTYTFVATANGCNSAPSTVSIAANPSPVISSVTATPPAICGTGNSQLNAAVSLPTQANQMTFAHATGVSLDPMVGATNLLTAPNDDTPTASPGAIGFSFNFNGVSYTQFSASPDGWILLGPTTASNQFTNQVTSTTNIPKIYPYWDDVALGGSGGYVRSVVTGTPGNRILKIEWFVTIPRDLSGPANSTFQCWLYETSNKIEFRYGTMASSAMSSSVGITAGATNYQSVTIASNTASTSVPNDANGGQPPVGTMYSFTPLSISSYAWAPSGLVSDPTIANPVASGLSATTTFTVSVASNAGCVSTGTVIVTYTAPPVVVAGSYGPACSSDAPIALGGSPVGGTWSGTGVSGGFFFPSVGTQTITYTYVDGICVVSDQTTITVTTATTWFFDADGDTFGDPFNSTQACVQPPGYVANNSDLCDNDPLKINPGQCGCGVPDTDSDGDGTADCVDGCPLDPNKIAPGFCGCGNLETDTDGDGLPDCVDGCPLDPNKIAPGQCGCGNPDTDTDGDGIADCVDVCPLLPYLSPGDPCDDGLFYTINDEVDANCVCVGQLNCTLNTIFLDITTDANGFETSWDIVPTGGGSPLCSGSGLPNSQTTLQFCCLNDGCYDLRVFDSNGDGMCCAFGAGGYIMRDGNNQRIIDNAGDGIFGSLSQAGNSFCVPIGTDGLVQSSCDIENHLSTSVLQASENSNVTANYSITATLTGYQFWIFNPDGGYSRRIFQSHQSPGDAWPIGTPNPQKATFLRLNSITSNPVPNFTLLNVRVRGRINGVYFEFGPACRMKVDPTAPCATTQLTTTANPVISCNATGVTLDGTANATIWANEILGAQRYQFEFTGVQGPGAGQLRRVVSPSRSLVLSFFVQNPLFCGTQYNVRVRATFDNSTTNIQWCPWGSACSVTTVNCNPGQGGRVASDEEAGLSLYPNPNRGDQVVVRVTGLTTEEQNVTIEVVDLFGKRVITETMPAAGILNTTLDLNGNLASGMYMVNVTAGDVTYSQRLVIQ
ncbi:MAG: T9SS type A sorting domain-containing protein [Flavobacteriales bacterium]|nr:T9SS type A sorting domain-containing protein [Flavobacteriales bacterium]